MYISEFVRSKPECRIITWLDATDEFLLFLSILTLGEIRKGIVSLSAGTRRAALDAWLDSDLTVRFADRLLPVDKVVADRWGRLSAKTAGRPPLPVIDGLLAATALEYNLTLVTRNAKDVAPTGVPVFDPWHD